MNTQMIIVKAYALMRKHGLDSSWSFVIDRNPKARGGQTRYASKQIALSLAYMEVATKDEINNTILHEIAHALVGPGQGHNDIWRAVFIGLGGNGERCMSERSARAIRAATARYRLVCEKGCEIGYRYRKSNIIKTKVCAKHRANLSFQDIA